MRFICLLALLLMYVPVFSQEPAPITILGINKGLSNNSVTSLYPDADGYMWIGTYDGLNRYDGNAFKVFRNKPKDSSSLINNRIVSILSDANKNTWVGTKQGLSVYNFQSGQFSTPHFLNQENKRTKLSVAINDLERNEDGDMLIASAGMGLLVYNHANAVTKAYPLVINKNVQYDYHVQGIEITDDQEVWLFVQGVGLCKFNKAQQNVTLITSEVLGANCVEVDAYGNFWIGSENGLFHYNKTTESYAAINGLSNNTAVALFNEKATLWVGTDGGGINLVDIKTKEVKTLENEPIKQTGLSVFAIAEDQQKRKWVGSLRGGVHIIDPHKNRFETIAHLPNQNSLIHNFVSAFCEENKDQLWIGTDGGGLSLWNRSKLSFENFKNEAANPNSLSNNFITQITKDSRANTWVATYGGGINRYNPATKSFKRYPCYNSVNNNIERNVWTLYEDRHKKLWAGACAPGSLYYFDPTTDAFLLYDNNLQDVVTMTEDRAGNLWAGTFFNLIKIDPQKKRHVRYHIGKPVRAIHQDKKGNFWIGTEGNGLLLLNPANGRYQSFTENEGLANNTVLRILEDTVGNLWISTFNGLSKFNPTTRHFENFYQSDGLQSNQFNYNAAIALHSGEFGLGGINGFDLFKPTTISPNNQFGKVLLTDVRVNNLPVGQQPTLVVKSGLNGLETIRFPFNSPFSVDFVTPEFTAPDKINYAYYLKGWDKDWNNTGKIKTANYSRLLEGNYTLYFKCTNTAGEWGPPHAALSIQVTPPWFRSWWAYLLYFLVVVALGYIYLAYKSRQSALEFAIKLSQVEKEKEKEINEKKYSFFTNIAHEFRTPLTLIINPIKALVQHKKEVIESKDLDIVYRNASRLLGLVDQLLLFRRSETNADRLKISHLNFSDLCHQAFQSFLPESEIKNLKYHWRAPDHAVWLYADHEKMDIILFNLLSNAFKFTPAGGNIHFTLTDKPNSVAVEISDTGRGMPADTGDKLFEKFYQVQGGQTSLQSGFGIGLYLVKSLVEIHSGSIKYETEPGKGTRFYLEFLKGKTHFGETITEVNDEPRHSVLLEELTQGVLAQSMPQQESIANESLQEIISGEQSLLIVEDDPESRNYLRSIFMGRFTVLEADNGLRGYEIAQQNIPDLIISDIKMAGLNGIELVEKIRGNENLRHIPVILLTGSSGPEIKLQGIKGGADDYITKPFEKEVLEARVDNLLNKKTNLQQYFFNEITHQHNPLKISEEYKVFLDKCIKVVEKHLDDDNFSIKVMAAEMGMSHSNLYKKVKAISGKSVNAFIRFIRLRKAAALLISSDNNINMVAYQAGFSDIKHFREEFHKLFGMNPSEYIKKYRKVFSEAYTLKERTGKKENKKADRENESAKKP